MHGRARWLWVALAAVVIVCLALVVAVRLTTMPPASDAGQSAGTSPATSRDTSSPGSASSAAASAGRPAPTGRPTAAGASGGASSSSLSDSGTYSGTSSSLVPGVTQVGISLVAQADSNGTLEVLERIRLAKPVFTLTLRAPQPVVSALAGTHPTVANLQAQVGPRPIPVPAPTSTGSDGSLELRLTTPRTRVWLRYQLTDATVHTQPSPQGRVLATIGPISAAGLGSTPVSVQVGGALNLVCPQLPASEQVCGATHPMLLSAGPVPADESTMVAQIDLPTSKH